MGTCLWLQAELWHSVSVAKKLQSPQERCPRFLGVDAESVRMFYGLYNNIMVLTGFVNNCSHGFDGRACVLRAFCDASKMVTPRSGIFLKLFRMIFSWVGQMKQLVTALEWLKYYVLQASIRKPVHEQQHPERRRGPVSLLEIQRLWWTGEALSN